MGLFFFGVALQKAWPLPPCAKCVEWRPTTSSDVFGRLLETTFHGIRFSFEDNKGDSCRETAQSKDTWFLTALTPPPTHCARLRQDTGLFCSIWVEIGGNILIDRGLHDRICLIDVGYVALC